MISARGAAVNVGESVVVAITLSSAPEGISGYIIEVEVADRDVARIEHVTFPDFGLARVVPSTGPGLRLAAADLLHRIESGAEDSTLASLVVFGIQAGMTEIGIVVELMSTEDGEPTTPLTQDVRVNLCSEGITRVRRVHHREGTESVVDS